jgi:uncharacterized membrane protein
VGTEPIYLLTPALHKIAPPSGLRFSSDGPSPRDARLKLLIRHALLTGVALSGVSHLLLNDDNRLIALFGGMTAAS